MCWRSHRSDVRSHCKRNDEAYPCTASLQKSCAVRCHCVCCRGYLHRNPCNGGSALCVLVSEKQSFLWTRYRYVCVSCGVRCRWCVWGLFQPCSGILPSACEVCIRKLHSSHALVVVLRRPRSRCNRGCCALQDDAPSSQGNGRGQGEEGHVERSTDAVLGLTSSDNAQKGTTTKTKTSTLQNSSNRTISLLLSPHFTSLLLHPQN
mmetsp:Transcript_30453/g.35174  ORF Transcript_30453/g.35174 Transcript_30453/m.35174 type:complete len:206 (-) Transcript_30453:35-652(-)